MSVVFMAGEIDILISDGNFKCQNIEIFSGPNNFTKAQAVMMIQNLSVDERKMFLKELKKTVATRDRFLKPSGADLRQLAYHNSLPFVGFGFLDNFIMIIAGEYIDLTLGKCLTII